jgi:hypothetical protein
MSDFAAQFNAALKKAMSRSEAAAIAGRASAAARRAKAGGGSGQTTDVQAATDKAKRLIAASPGKYGPKGAKGKGKGKAKAKDPKAEAAKAKEKADRAAEHAQRQKEHAEDRAQHQADREQRAKEHAQAQAEHAQSRAEHEADRATRQKQQAERAKQQAAKAKGKTSAGKKTGGTRGTGQMDVKTQAADVKQERLNTATASRVGAALASGGKVNSGDAARLVGAGLARQNGADLELTPQGQSLLSQKMAKRRHARAWEAEMLTKAELPNLARNAEQSLQKYV